MNERSFLFYPKDISCQEGNNQANTDANCNSPFLHPYIQVYNCLNTNAKDNHGRANLD